MAACPATNRSLTRHHPPANAGHRPRIQSILLLAQEALLFSRKAPLAPTREEPCACRRRGTPCSSTHSADFAHDLHARSTPCAPLFKSASNQTDTLLHNRIGRERPWHSSSPCQPPQKSIDRITFKQRNCLATASEQGASLYRAAMHPLPEKLYTQRKPPFSNARILCMCW